ncbi:MAG: L-aspartate oxidase [Desulfovibrionaceae bacterium]
MSIKNTTYDVLIVGGGLAALSTAYSLGKKGYSIALLVPTSRHCGGNSSYAQGGIVYTDFLNDPKALQKDILYAGVYDQDENIVTYFAENAPSCVKKILIDELGIFSEEESRNNLTKEGGHSVKRILYKGDHIGKSIMHAFTSVLEKYTNVHYIENSFACEVLLNNEKHCIGVKAIVGNTLLSVFAHNTIFATGGIGALYKRSTNPCPVFASAIAMAYEKSIALSHLEYIQFHPTAVFHQESKSVFLLSETLRGEGAILLNKDGKAFAKEYHPLADLAPRDVLTRAILMQMKKDNSDCVYLDARKSSFSLQERFPTIYLYCLHNIGLDIEKSCIPIVPAMHYSCGGIAVDKFGQTSCANLYAIGECSYTGIHGANRLASTSLLEALFWGTHVIKSITQNPNFSNVVAFSAETIYEENRPLYCQKLLCTIQNIMWDDFGIFRETVNMKRSLEKLQEIRHECTVLWNKRKSKERIQLLHAVIASCAIAEQCIANTISKGCHHIVDV